jgi:hypothetical protein
MTVAAAASPTAATTATDPLIRRLAFARHARAKVTRR